MFEISTELKELASRVIASKKGLDSPASPECRIAYLYSDQAKKSSGKKVFADTEKLSDKVKALAPYDFVITFYRPNTEPLTPEKMEILMYHELRHIGFAPDGKCSIIPHDVEDFSDILESFGMRWVI